MDATKENKGMTDFPKENNGTMDATKEYKGLLFFEKLVNNLHFV